MRALWQAVFLGEAILFEIYTMPLANQFDSVRQSIADFLVRSREQQVEALAAFLAARPRRQYDPSPEAIAVFIRGVARELSAEQHLGVGSGHPEAIATIERYLASFD